MTTTKENFNLYSPSEKRKIRSPEEKQAMVQETYQPGMSVSIIARKYGIFPSQLFYWRRLMEQGALSGIKAQEEVVAISEIKALQKRMHELERALGRMTLDNQILKETIEIGRKKNSYR